MNGGGMSKVSQPMHIGATERCVIVALLGLLLTAIGSTALHLFGVMSIDTQKPNEVHWQLISLVVVSLISLLLMLLHIKLRFRLVALKMPIVQSPIPFFGHALAFIVQSPWDSMLQWHKHFGETFTFTLMGRTMVSLSNPDHMKLVLQSKISAVKKDVGFSYQPFMVILGKGIVTSEDSDWMKQRLKMSTALRITVLDIIPQITLKAVQRIMATLDDAAETGKSVDLVESLRCLTLQVISNTFLSISFNESDATFAKLYLPIVDECNTRVWHPYRAFCFFLPSWWLHSYRVRQLNTYVSNLIQNRWKDRREGRPRKDDILDLVLDAYEKDHSKYDVIPAGALKQIRDEFKTFMLAGHETSASMMTWALYEMMANPALMKEAVAESETIFGNDRDWAVDSDLPSRDKLAGLVYAEGCLKESLRKYSIVPLTIRRVVSDLDLGDYQIPAGSTLALNLQAVHHNPKYWPSPMSFDPTRFVDRKPAPYTFLPFLEGPRNCLGQHLSLLESKIVLALLAGRYNFESEKDIVTELGCKETDPRHQYIVPVTPKEQLNVLVKKRL